MSEAPRSNKAARRGAGSPTRLQTPRRAGWLVALSALAVVGLFLAMSSCSDEADHFDAATPPSNSSSSGSGCVGEGCPGQCGAHPAPGCGCSVEGQHLLCSKVDVTFPMEENAPGATVCGKGFSVCTNGVWGECTIDSAVTVVPNAPPGFYEEGLGTGSTCLNNPCDPACVDFVDTPTGLDGGLGITATDAGLTLTGDGGNVCVARTCADLGKNCGPVSDTCGGLLQCGACIGAATCGGGGVASVCGVPATCTGLCLQQVHCPNGGTTSITGTVYAPNGTTPLPNAIVYVPNAAVQPFSAGVACVTSTNCTEASGAPLVSTTTAVDGTFTLTNMPVGTNIPLVIQIGRFRRQLTIPTVASCVNTDTSHPSTSSTCKANGQSCSSASQCCSGSCSKSNGANPICDPPTRLPKNKSEGDIPKMAFVTGKVDALECVWRKVGIDDSEFTTSSGTGRINFFQGNFAAGTYITSYSNTPNESALIGSPSTLANYDMVLFPCQGAEYFWSNGNQATYENNLASYVNAGGRVFTTHYSYIYIYSDPTGTCKANNATCTQSSDCCSGRCSGNSNKRCQANNCFPAYAACTQNSDCCDGQCYNGSCRIYSSPLSSAITWAINQGSPTPDPGTGYINTSFTKGSQLAQWLQIVGASTTLGQISINTLRHDFNGVVAPTQLWMSLGDGTPMEATFNTPIASPAAQQCGRVVNSDFHVETSNNTQFAFPNECAGGAMDPQEFLLTDMLFDLASCVTPDNAAAACVPIDCSAQGLNCGMAGDGCGNQINCGTCTAPTTCGGGGIPGVCGTPITYSDAYFVRDYNASTLCAAGTNPVWRLYSWSAITPADSHIDFSIQTATTAAGLAAAPSDALLFSNPPGPVALLNQSASAHAVNMPSGSPDTELGAASPDYTLLTKKRNQGDAFVRVTAHLVPSSDKLHAPTLSSWDMQIDCAANQ